MPTNTLAQQELQGPPSYGQGVNNVRGPLGPRPEAPASPQVPPDTSPQGFQGAAPLNQIYGLLAKYSDNPSAVGNQYVVAQQRQQEQDRANSPIETFLRLYGNVNPYDFTPESLQAFHRHYVQTGGLKFDLLKNREDLSAVAEKELAKAVDTAEKTQADMYEMADVANKYDEYARNGGLSRGLVTNIEKWAHKTFGTQDMGSLLRSRYNAIRNSLVIAGLPPGVASDADIQIAREPWPPANASPAYIAAFLRGLTKLKAIEQAYAAHKAQYISRNSSQKGEWDDWNANSQHLSEIALEQYGGIHPPVHEDGAPMTLEEAAQAHYHLTPTRTLNPLQAPDTENLPSLDSAMNFAKGGE